jgi:hypothetical protein
MVTAIGDGHEIVKKVIEAHGGEVRWQKLEAIEADISVRGFLFTVKRRPILERVRIRASTREPKFVLYDYPRAGRNSEFIGDREVRITSGDDQVLVSRQQPRAAFRQFRRKLYWDALDFTYFGGYATWNYLVTPFLFLRDGIRFERLEPLRSDSEHFTRLQVSFPADIPTHCQQQVFYFDRNFLLHRLDYTAEVVSRWAHAAHICDSYQEFEGLQVPTRRRVFPIITGNKPLAGPILVAIDIHDFQPIYTEGG